MKRLTIDACFVAVLKYRIGLSLVMVTLATFSKENIAQVVFDNPRLDEFVGDITDPYDLRHYRLASKQSAIHGWLVRDCMQSLGFDDEASSEGEDWNDALFGKYAYCQDHFIPGVDPPCPTDAVIQSSIKNSCFHNAYDQIDSSSDIMHAARKGLADLRSQDNSDVIVNAIEQSWSSCMEGEGHNYQSRVEMMSSFDEALARGVDLDELSIFESEVMRSAELCFESTGYHKKYEEHFTSIEIEYFKNSRALIEALLDRYEVAELKADDAIAGYCEIDRKAIMQMYEKNKMLDESICN